MYQTNLVTIQPTRTAYTRRLMQKKTNLTSLIRFVFVYLLFLMIGLPCYSYLKNIWAHRTPHLLITFVRLANLDFSDLPGFFFSLLDFLKRDVWWICAVYACASSFLCGALHRILLALRGFSIGVALGYLVYALNCGRLPPVTGAYFIIYESLRSAILLYAVQYSCNLYARLRALEYHSFGATVTLLLVGGVQCIFFAGLLFVIAIFFSFLF